MAPIYIQIFTEMCYPTTEGPIEWTRTTRFLVFYTGANMTKEIFNCNTEQLTLHIDALHKWSTAVRTRPDRRCSLHMHFVIQTINRERDEPYIFNQRTFDGYVNIINKRMETLGFGSVNAAGMSHQSFGITNLVTAEQSRESAVSVRLLVDGIRKFMIGKQFLPRSYFQCREPYNLSLTPVDLDRFAVPDIAFVNPLDANKAVEPTKEYLKNLEGRNKINDNRAVADMPEDQSTTAVRAREAAAELSKKEKQEEREQRRRVVDEIIRQQELLSKAYESAGFRSQRDFEEEEEEEEMVKIVIDEYGNEYILPEQIEERPKSKTKRMRKTAAAASTEDEPTGCSHISNNNNNDDDKTESGNLGCLII